MRPRLTVLALVALGLLGFSNSGVAGADAARKLPKISLSLSGPTSVRRNESLELLRFQAVLTNRGSEPLLLFVRDGYLLNARWNWTVTDAEGMPMGMQLVERGFCSTPAMSPEAEAAARRIHDSDLVALAPGESREFPVPGGPSDDYDFPASGTYRFAVTLDYLPPNAGSYLDEQGQRHKATGYEQWDLSQLSVQGAAALRKSFSLYAMSNAWEMALPAARPHKNALIILPTVALSDLNPEKP